MAVPDPRLQERACLRCLAAGADGFTLGELREFLAGRGVARPYRPERLEILEAFPTAPSGKIQKFHLRGQVAVAG